MKKEKNYKKHYHLALVIIIILVILMAIFIFRAYRNYSVFEQHRHYFSNSSKELEIQPWMNINLITSNFNITRVQIANSFNVTIDKIATEASLYRLCRQYRKNCNNIIDELNKIK